MVKDIVKLHVLVHLQPLTKLQHVLNYNAKHLLNITMKHHHMSVLKLQNNVIQSCLNNLTGVCKVKLNVT